jgi:hypothetical protein
MGEVSAPCDAPGQDKEVEDTEEGGGSRGSGTTSDVRSRCRVAGPTTGCNSVWPGPSPNLLLAPPSCVRASDPPPAERMVARDTGPDANEEDGADGAGSPTKEKSLVKIV